MMLLEEVLVCGGVSPARPGSTKGFASVDGSAQCQGSQCTALSPQQKVVHPGHVPCPEQCATREVVLEREDSGALLEAL